MTGYDLKEVLLKVRCIVDYDFIAELFEGKDKYSIDHEWNLFNANWTQWYCQLYDLQQTKFMNMLYERD